MIEKANRKSMSCGQALLERADTELVWAAVTVAGEDYGTAFRWLSGYGDVSYKPYL